ncbi:MAG: peptidylprolyl isomerase [Coprothermobacterota bacterium]|nr:peptidylprolyl isomerase [Coprothermobacterota bacterium]
MDRRSYGIESRERVRIGVITLILTLCLLFTFVVSCQREKVIVKVDGLTASLEDFQKEYALVKAQLIRNFFLPQFDENQPGGEELKAKITSQALEELTNKLLIKAESLRLKIVVTQKELEKELNILKELYGKEELYQNDLKALYGGSEELLLQDLENRILLEKILAQKFPDSFSASPEELKKYFEEHPEDFKRKEKLHIEVIDLGYQALPESSEQIQKLGENLEGQGLVNDLGYLPQDEVPEPLKGQAEGVNFNEWHLVQTATVNALFRVLDRIPSKSFGFEEIEPLVWRAYYAQKIQEFLPGLYQELREKYNPVVNTP